ncbi:hypothetical protein ScPMuIL_001591 [Solemya velum]
MPKSLLLIIRNMNTVRAITREHGHPVDRYTIMARSAITGIHKNDKQTFGLLGKFLGWWEKVMFENKLRLENWKIWLGFAFLKMLQMVGKAPSMDTVKQLIEDEEKRLEKL